MMIIMKEKLLAKNDIYDICMKKRYNSSSLAKCIELYPEALTEGDEGGRLPLHLLLENLSSSIEDALMMIEKYPAALRHQNNRENLPIHIECMNRCRSAIISKCIEQYPEELAKVGSYEYLPLHWLFDSNSSTIEDALMMIEKYPAALQHQTFLYYKNLPLHMECSHQCRSIIIAKCIELYPEALAMAGGSYCLPLHCLLKNDTIQSLSIEDALMMIEKYPAALQHRNGDGQLPLHLTQSSVITAKCIEIYPEALAIADDSGFLPLHSSLENHGPTIDALLMMEKYPAALQHRTSVDGYLPLHVECIYLARSEVIRKCIELYPQALSAVGERNLLPLHYLLQYSSSSIEDALMMMMEKYPAALQHRNQNTDLPLHIECENQCRSAIILRCIELYPEALDDKAILAMTSKLDMHTFPSYAPLLSSVFTAYPTWLYHTVTNITRNAVLYRKVFNLLPAHVFEAHASLDANYRHMNWQPRAAIIMLLAKIHLQVIMSKPAPGMQANEAKSGWRSLLVRIFEVSTVVSQPVDNTTTGLCQQEDIGDMLLRSITAYL